MDKHVVHTIAKGLKSPTFIATADVHLGKKLYNKPELEEDLKTNFKLLADMAIEHKVQYLVVAGDLFEDNNQVRPHLMAFVTQTRDRLLKHGVRLVGIAGDHDKPVKGASWIRVAGIEPVTVEPTFTGFDYFDYSTVSEDEIVNLLRNDRDPNQVMWIFLHCQFPQLFDKSEPKKLIDYNHLKLFENFPNLQGIIAGDIHYAPESSAFGIGFKAYVGYTGSLGVLDKQEYKHKKHVLHFDGETLYHLPFPIVRPTRDIDIRGEMINNLDIDAEVAWAKSQKLKPVVYILYDIASENYLPRIVPLFDVALVKILQQKFESKEEEQEESISCRGQANSQNNIDVALRNCCGDDKELYNLASALLNEDVKTTLDDFKNQFKL